MLAQLSRILRVAGTQRFTVRFCIVTQLWVIVAALDGLICHIWPRFAESEFASRWVGNVSMRMLTWAFPGILYYPIDALYCYKVLRVSAPAKMALDTRGEVRLLIKNTGKNAWVRSQSLPWRIGTWNPLDGDSDFYDPESWLSPNRITALPVERVDPGEAVEIACQLHAPEKPGQYTETWNVVIDGLRWFPPQNLQFRTQVT